MAVVHRAALERRGSLPQSRSRSLTPPPQASFIWSQQSVDRLASGTNLLASGFEVRARTKAIEDNRHLPSVQGVLKQLANRGPLGVLGEVARSRWFKLNPANATFSYWIPGCCCGPPRKAFNLDELEEFDTNEYHQRIFLKFKGEAVLRLKANRYEDYLQWIDILMPYLCPAAHAIAAHPPSNDAIYVPSRSSSKALGVDPPPMDRVCNEPASESTRSIVLEMPTKMSSKARTYFSSMRRSSSASPQAKPAASEGKSCNSLLHIGTPYPGRS
jgi:hypothetical protein